MSDERLPDPDHAPPPAPLRAKEDPAGSIAHRIERTGSSVGGVHGLVFCSGFHSSMSGIKATRCSAWATRRKLDCLRFDYRGHGASGGDPRTLGIGDWFNNTLDMLALTDGPQLLIGSSMGAWLAVLAAQAQPDRVAGVLTLAAAPDFTERLRARLPRSSREAIDEGRTAWHRPNGAEAPWPLPPVLFRSGRQNAVLANRTPLGKPLSLLHGTADTEVPPALSRELLEAVGGPDDSLMLLPDADHRLSDDASLAVIERALDALLVRISRSPRA